MVIYLLVASCVLVHAGYGGAKVAIPLHALHLGMDSFDVGIIMALSALCPMLIALWVGRLVDRVGGRGPMLWGACGVVAAVSIPLFFTGAVALYAMALLVSTAFQFFFVPTQGITGSLGKPEDRARNYSMLAIGFSIASFLGPLIAGYSIDYLGYQLAYAALAAGPVCAALLLWRRRHLLPKAPDAPAQKRQRGSSFELMRNTRMRDAVMASCLLSTGWDLYQFYFPIYGHALGLSASTIGTVMSTFALAVCSIRLVLPHLARRWGELHLLLHAIGFAGLALLLIPLFRDPWLLAGISFLLGLGCGVGQPMSMSLIYSVSPPGRASEGAALRIMFNHGTHLIVPVAFGGLGTLLGFAPVFMSGAALLMGGSWYGEFTSRKAARAAQAAAARE